MFSSIFSAMSGMTGFSRALDVISNNVANINTPGFKATELVFRDMFYRHGSGDGSENLGQGLNTGATRTDFRQGELRETGRPTDLAIDGDGFFVLQKDGETFYTRAGQFVFDDRGVLVDSATGARVAAYDGSGLEDVSIAGLRVNPQRPTSRVSFNNTLNIGATGGNTHTLSNVTVFDANGASHALSVAFTQVAVTSPTGGSEHQWNVEIEDGTTQVGAGTLLYRANDPVAGQDRVQFDYAPAGSASTTITLDFSGTQALSGSGYTVRVGGQDGYAAGALTETSFGADGSLTLRYSNGQTAAHGKLALAWFEDLQALTFVGNNLLRAGAGQKPMIGAAGGSGLGEISAGHIELSNVELTEQFTDIVIIQRGYQASSQVISVANEMAQQLMNLRSRR